MKHSYWYGIALTLSLLANSALAGDDKTHGSHDRHGPDMDKRMQHLSEELELTEEQSELLQAVMEAAALEREAVRDKYAEQIEPELCAIHLTTVEQIREILTAEQAAEMESRMERWSSVEGKGGKFRGKGHPMMDCGQAD